jgi:uncharacterized protein YkwD
VEHPRPDRAAGGAHARRGLVLPGPVGLAVLVAALLITFGAGTALLAPTFATGAGSPAAAGNNRAASGPGTAAPINTPADVPAPTPTPTAKPTPRPTRTKPRTARKPPRKADNLPASGVTGTENEVTVLVNRERARAGCGRVRTDERLRRAARGHSRDMAERNFFSHTSPDGRSPWDRAGAAGYDRAIGENIAKGQRTPESVMSAWMNSEGHRRNILNCDARATGVGLAYDGGDPVWTQLFGAV